MYHVPNLVDHHAYNASGYTETNEEPSLFIDMLQKRRFNRAACIASGGEVLLSVILPRAKEVVAIDHSYRSLGASYRKLLLLQKLGGSQTTALLRDEKYDELKQHLVEIVQQLPEKVKALGDISTVMHSLRREWSFTRMPARVTPKIAQRVTFVHGDLSDLGKHGTFDLLYISNAMEHTNRDYKSPTFNTVVPFLNPGGLLLYTSNDYYAKSTPLPKGFTLVNRIRGFRTQWVHSIIQKDAAIEPKQDIQAEVGVQHA